MCLFRRFGRGWLTTGADGGGDPRASSWGSLQVLSGYLARSSDAFLYRARVGS